MARSGASDFTHKRANSIECHWPPRCTALPSRPDREGASWASYAGSLTTPPCTETVTWFVLHEYAQLSSEQFDAFRHILGNDFRPTQKRNGRAIRSTVGEDDEQ